MITIWIDADSCPTRIRKFLIKFSQRENQFTVKFVANKKLDSVEENQMIICDKFKDSADNYIFENVQKKDLVITRDIILAERLVKKEIYTINDRGTIFTKENIKEKVEDRNYDFNLAQLGFSSSKEKNYGQNEFIKFKECFDKFIKFTFTE